MGITEVTTMKNNIWVFVVSAVVGLSGLASAYDPVGRLGLNYTLGPSFIAGGSGATSVSSVEPGVGAALQYGLMRNIDLTFSYDYVDASVRAQALTFGGQFRLAPERAL